VSLAGALYRRALRPALFALDAERAHDLTLRALAVAHRAAPARAALRAAYGVDGGGPLAVEVFGRRFATPLGVAAGLDKGAAAYNALGALGFAFVEVGTVTALPQPGNPRPRLFRLPRDGAVINRMGFNNPGCEAAARALAAHPPDGVIVGVNLGKSKVTALADAPADYAAGARALGPFADYAVINVSSPNTPGLRSLQSVDALAGIVRAVRPELAGRAVPLLVKIAPDLADEDVDAVVDLCLAEGLAGIVATNTTLRRDGLATPADAVRAMGDGGLSGAPLRDRSRAVVARIFARAGRALLVVGVGGVSTADDAWALVEAGASLVQVYTGFIYRGPTMARELAAGLRARLAADGAPSLAAVVGRRARG
jgi:dihydroorotate dehydrogenase